MFHLRTGSTIWRFKIEFVLSVVEEYTACLVRALHRDYFTFLKVDCRTRRISPRTLPVGLYLDYGFDTTWDVDSRASNAENRNKSS